MSDGSDAPRAEFEQAVERIVAPLRAGPRRKAVMREELLAHLLGTYAQELDRSGNSPAAIDATIRRFGEGDALSRELEASVPALERMAAMFFGNERRRWILLVLVGLFVMLFGTTMVLPALAKLKHLANLSVGREPLMTIVAGVAVGVAIAVTGLHLLAWGIIRRLRQTT